MEGKTLLLPGTKASSYSSCSARARKKGGDLRGCGIYLRSLIFQHLATPGDQDPRYLLQKK